MNMRLKVRRDYACPLCGASEACPEACPANEWPPRVTPKEILTQLLITLALLLAVLAMLVPKQGLALGLALTGLGTMFVVALLTLTESRR